MRHSSIPELDLNAQYISFSWRKKGGYHTLFSGKANFLTAYADKNGLLKLDLYLPGMEQIDYKQNEKPPTFDEKNLVSIKLSLEKRVLSWFTKLGLNVKISPSNGLKHY